MKQSIQSISLILGLSLFFSACAPTTVSKGGSVYRPLETNELGMVMIPEAQTSYIRHTINPKAVGISSSVSNDILGRGSSLDSKGDTLSRRIQHTFQSIDVDTILGGDASVNIKRVNLVRKVTDVDEGYIYFEDYVEIILEIVLTEDSSSLSIEGLMVSFTRQGETHKVPILISTNTSDE